MESLHSSDPDRYRVTLIDGEGGGSGFRLTRLLEWAGLERSKFDIITHELEDPNGNPLPRPDWSGDLARSVVAVPLGNAASGVFIGRKGILSTRGYVYSGIAGIPYVLPTVHPTFIQRGQSKWSAPFIHDLQKAVELAGLGGPPPTFLDYCLDPTPAVAYQWASNYRSALRADHRLRLAFDIETPGKVEDESDLDISDDLPDATWNIERIGFSYRGLGALSIPWEPPFFAAIRLLLDSDGEKVVWNAGFDVPRIRRAGFPINGLIHDGMVAWHILHSDLPKRLGFVATFTCPWQPAWKHLSGAKPAFYNATDADVELRSMEVIESELRKSGLWDVYQRDVIDLQPVLDHMQAVGMRVDASIRADRAVRLDVSLKATRAELEALIPIEARRIEHVYTNTPKDTTGLLSRPGTRKTTQCPGCGLSKPRKDHFKSYVKKVNPCANLAPENCTVGVEEFYRLAPFKLSRNLLISYHQHLGRQLPLVWDKKEGRRKVSFDEEQMKKLILKFPLDRVYPLVLQYRSLDKLAGTYIGRPIE